MSTRDELIAINEEFSAALARQDAAHVAGLYTDDARLLFSGMPIIRGRAAIAAMFRDDVQGGPATIRFESEEILEDGRLVVDIGRYITPTGSGKYVVVYERQPDGSLKLAVDAASGNGTAPAA